MVYECRICIGCECEPSNETIVEDCKGYIDRNKPKPTRFDQFRNDTATIDGLVEWCVINGNCLSCSFYTKCPLSEEDEMTSEQQDEHCKQGIKAYWEVTE